jgi:hypothetical protein
MLGLRTTLSTSAIFLLISYLWSVYASTESITTLPFINDADVVDSVETSAARSPHSFHVAIIGAGIGGASTAYYLNHLELLDLSNSTASTSSLPLKIDLYEKNAEPGGHVISRLFYNGDANDNDGDGIPN